MPSNTLDSTPASNQSPTSLPPLRWVGIALAAVTGAIHLWLGVARGAPPLLVAGIGFVAGTVAVVLGVRRHTVILLGIPFTAGQILLYLVARAPNFSPLGLGDRIAQVALLAVLVALYRRQ